MPASPARLLLADRETKNAVAGIASLFIGIALLPHQVGPAVPPTPASNEAGSRFLPPASATATPGKPLRIDPAIWKAIQSPSPFTALAAPSQAAPFFYKGSSDDREHAVDCLAAAAWYEAGNDPEGQKSVMQVVLNRVRHPSFPKTVCGVVFQGSERTTGCQFTFTCDGSMQRRFPPVWAWNRARQLSEKALEGSVDAAVGQATHYHADYVSPWWSSALQRVNQIGAHIFYRWPGGRGNLVRSRNSGAEPGALEAVQLGNLPSPRDIAAGTPEALIQAGVLASVAAGPTISPRISQAHLIAIDPRSPTGRWAVAALDQCAGRASCSAMGYAQGPELARNTNVEPELMERPLFLFVRDAASGMELALWDCDRAPRPQASQCLPRDSKALAQLMRNR